VALHILKKRTVQRIYIGSMVATGNSITVSKMALKTTGLVVGLLEVQTMKRNFQVKFGGVLQIMSPSNSVIPQR